MELEQLNAKEFKRMIIGGQARLEEHIDYVNALNVFPVPDGDTGTNMSLTFTSGKDAIINAGADHLGEVGQVLAKGLLMGARGNSGVILSQLFRGFTKTLVDLKTADAKEFAAAFQGGVDAAYQAIMKPVEGTILTVARESAEAGVQAAETETDIIALMKVILDAAQRSLDHTPELLPVLKEVGFVDSGGQGLLFIYEGFLAALTGEELPEVDTDIEDLSTPPEFYEDEAHDLMDPEDIVYGYCTEIMVRLGEGETVDSTFDYDTFREHLSTLGDSLLVINDDDIVKVHVHTETPGEVMNYGQKFGSLIRIKVDNMREQNRELQAEKAKRALPQATKAKKDLAVVTVSAGAGVAEMFESLGVDYVLAGGQTMNPSTQDFVAAMEKVPARSYLLLPNNSNIFMAAKQAAEVSEVPTAVVETRTIQQGMAAMLGFNPEFSLDENVESMSEEMTHTTSGQVTVAVRDTEIDGLKMKKDDYIGLVDGDIKVTDKDLNQIVLRTLAEMIDEDSEIVTLIYGEELTEDAAEELVDLIEEEYSEVDVELYEGDQPVYPYLIAVE